MTREGVECLQALAMSWEQRDKAQTHGGSWHFLSALTYG